MNVPHLGSLIRQEMQRQERTPSWLARKIHCHRVNIYDIYSRPSLDTDLLQRISLALGHNFLRDVADALQTQLDSPTP